MQKKFILFLIMLFVYSTHVKTMEFKSSRAEHSVRYSLGALMVGVGATCLLYQPENNLAQNILSSASCLKGLYYLNDVPYLESMCSTLILPFMGASLVAAQTRDKNRSFVDHLRALCAGGLLAGGLWEISKNLYHHAIKESLIGAGLFATGALLLSQKDIKTFFRRQQGNSLNPPESLKRLIKKDCKISEEKVEIKRVCLEIAEVGRKQAQPFFYRIASFVVNKLREEDTSLKKPTLWISKRDLVTNVLPYLRTDAALNEIHQEQDPITVFGVDPDTSRWMNKNSIEPYLTLEAYECANKIK